MKRTLAMLAMRLPVMPSNAASNEFSSLSFNVNTSSDRIKKTSLTSVAYRILELKRLGALHSN